MAIIEKLEENSIPYVLIDPRGASSTCPARGFRLVLPRGTGGDRDWSDAPTRTLNQALYGAFVAGKGLYNRVLVGQAMGRNGH